MMGGRTGGGGPLSVSTAHRSSAIAKQQQGLRPGLRRPRCVTDAEHPAQSPPKQPGIARDPDKRVPARRVGAAQGSPQVQGRPCRILLR